MAARLSKENPFVIASIAVIAVASGRSRVMQKAIDNFLFGIFFGMGFVIASNVLNFIAQFLRATH